MQHQRGGQWKVKVAKQQILGIRKRIRHFSVARLLYRLGASRTTFPTVNQVVSIMKFCPFTSHLDRLINILLFFIKQDSRQDIGNAELGFNN